MKEDAIMNNTCNHTSSTWAISESPLPTCSYPSLWYLLVLGLLSKSSFWVTSLLAAPAPLLPAPPFLRSLWDACVSGSLREPYNQKLTGLLGRIIDTLMGVLSVYFGKSISYLGSEKLACIIYSNVNEKAVFITYLLLKQLCQYTFEISYNGLASVI